MANRFESCPYCGRDAKHQGREENDNGVEDRYICPNCGSIFYNHTYGKWLKWGERP